MNGNSHRDPVGAGFHPRPQCGEGNVGHRVSGRRGSLPLRWIVAICLFPVLTSSCKWKPTYPASRIAASLRQLCRQDYQLTVETRHDGAALQALVWKAGLFTGRAYDLQGLRRDASSTLEQVLLCATRVALSTDAPLTFLQVKMVDVLTGASVTIWRYVPDIRDSMYQRIGDTEYFNRLLIEVQVDHPLALPGSALRWDTPISLAEFLARQIIWRVTREAGDGVRAHPDLSKSGVLGVVLENADALSEEDPDRVEKLGEKMHQTAVTVLRGYRFNGFHHMVLMNNEGLALHRWAL